MFNCEEYVYAIKKMAKSECVYIYGAGKVGNIIQKICNENNIKIGAFYVTKAENNKSEIQGIPVLQFDKNFNADDLILIGVVEHGEQNIKKYINGFGVYKTIDLPEEILFYDNFYNNRRKNPTMEITPIVGCTINCKYCPQNTFLEQYYKNNKKRKRILTLEDFKICLNKMPINTLIEWAGFVEPFINKDSIDMMYYASEKGYDMTLYTTLVGLSEEQLQRVLKLPFKQVVLHTADKYGYANIPITQSYLNMLNIITEAKKDNGLPFVDSANCQSEPHKKVLDVVKNRIKIYGEMSDRAGNLDNIDGNLKSVSLNGKILCERTLNLNHNVLLPDGTVVLCCNDFGMQHVLGNLFESEYEDIINGEEMHNIKRAMNTDMAIPIICRKCMYAKNK